LAEQWPAGVARHSTAKLEGIAWQTMRASGAGIAMAAKNRANGKPDIGLDAGILQTVIGAEPGFANRSPLPPMEQSKTHCLSSQDLAAPR
jgi:hypothetical protein